MKERTAKFAWLQLPDRSFEFLHHSSRRPLPQPAGAAALFRGWRWQSPPLQRCGHFARAAMRSSRIQGRSHHRYRPQFCMWGRAGALREGGFPAYLRRIRQPLRSLRRGPAIMRCKPAFSDEVAFFRKEYCWSFKKQSSLSLKFKWLAMNASCAGNNLPNLECQVS